jgi:hypothetical protein
MLAPFSSGDLHKRPGNGTENANEVSTHRHACWTKIEIDECNRGYELAVSQADRPPALIETVRAKDQTADCTTIQAKLSANNQRIVDLGGESCRKVWAEWRGG